MNKLLANAMCAFIKPKEKRDAVRGLLLDRPVPCMDYMRDLECIGNYVPLIRRSVPDMRIRSTKVLHGGSSTILLVNEKTIFKFLSERTARKEEALSRVLCRHVKSVPVPEARAFLDGPVSFIRYELLPGHPPQSSCITPEIQLQMARFMAEIHSIRLDSLPRNTTELLANKELRSPWARTMDRKEIAALRDLTGLDISAEIAKTNRMLRSCGDGDMVLIHGDLSFGNVLALNGRLSGIIDLGTMQPGPRLWDFSCFCLSTLSISAIIDEYNRIAKTKISRREVLLVSLHRIAVACSNNLANACLIEHLVPIIRDIAARLRARNCP